MRSFLYLFLCGFFPVATLPACGDQESPQVTVFAAASTTNAITETAELFTEKSGVRVVSSFASSSTLAKQIEQGAPAHIYLSANPKWTDYLEQRKMIVPGSRRDLLHNQLVLITPKESPLTEIDISSGVQLTSLLGTEKLAMGDPDHVPAGIYGAQSLRFLAIWDRIGPQVARAMDVRAALALVERKEAPFGIVYATDALISKQVKVVAIFPQASHGPITYPISQVSGKNTPEARSFLNYLGTPEATAIFEKYGFTIR